MQRKLMVFAVAVLWGVFASVAQAMDHGSMDGMKMDSDMIMLQGDTVDGVRAMAHLSDVRAAMAKMGLDATHHFMVMFTDARSGARVDRGTVALKITGPDGNQAKPLKLMAMDGSFGADISLPRKGAYRLTVGTKLQDGRKRRFRFEYTLDP